MKLLFVILLAYLIGSIPLERWIQQNFYYKVGWIQLTVDMGKGAVATLLAWIIGGAMTACMASIAVVIGDVYSLFRNLDEGNGISVATGSLLILSPILFLVGVLIYLISLLLTRYIFLSTILSTTSVIIFAFVLTSHLTVLFVILGLGLIILNRQRIHWIRFRRGAEPPFRYRKPFW